MDFSENNESDDDLWNTELTLVIKPDPRLNKDQQAIIAADYGMTRKSLRVKTRAALVEYTLQALNLDLKKLEAKASAQQIVVDNYTEIERYLY